MSARRVDNGIVTVIAIDKDKNSQHALKWAVENILVDSPNCVLLHVEPKGNTGAHIQRDNQDDSHQFFLLFRGFCSRKGIIPKEVLLREIDISSAIVSYITNNSISNIVVGASSHNAFFKKFKSPDVPTTLLKTSPETCAVFVVSKGKLLKSKSASQALKHHPVQQSLSTLLYNNEPTTSTYSSDSERESFVSTQHSKPMSDFSQTSSPPRISSTQTMSEFSQSDTDSGSYGMVSTVTSYTISQSSTTNGSSISSTSTESPHAVTFMEQQNQNLEAEVRRLRQELKQYNPSNNKESSQEHKLPRAKGVRRLDQAIEMPRALSEENQKRLSAIQAAEIAKKLAKMESQKRKLLEMQAKLEKQRMASNVSYRRYSIKDVEGATNGFSDSLKIGEGGYGPVYKAVLDYTSVAIKILKSGITQGLKQFQQEVEVLSSMRHPNMVILLGACPEYGCLVYEYMENGTLEDRLFCKDNTPPLSWRARFRIAAEVATGLLFLHHAKPEPLVHRDLKPANILLDRHFTSKISDVGLARLVPSSVADSYSNYHMTSAAGTFCYIDPEYQQTGLLGVKSDLYSFGVVLLQMITAMPAMGLGHKVEMAVENNKLSELFDPKVSEWPEEETLGLAKLALQCCELRKRDRPDLASVVLPALNRLREFAREDHERIKDRTSHVSQSNYSDPVPSSQISRKPTLGLPEIHGHLDQLKTRSHSVPRRSRRPPRSERSSQYKGNRWFFMSCAPSKSSVG
ncbi:PREDICTED: U-box domain-containing protein 35 [Brassica oleracea var. oleracea]|uniref:U-box domain-containing protein 35 n=1 Tax=Brassica oleracea var. oleracea TaxID=109376 RepID=UPI0006A6A606|nr:PREDICTED: U-box domain-containing protein 35 [Brassica oleracea var. oleracea]